MTQLLRELQNSEKLESIDKIQFSLFSHEDVKNGSVADILTFDTYEGNIPKNNGLFDHNMGSIDAAIFCPVDEKKAELCPGYFGKIDLALPVFNPHFIGIVEKLLKCVCFHCSKLLIDKENPTNLSILGNKKGNIRFKLITELCSKQKKCMYNGGCQALQPVKYMRVKDNINHMRIFAEFSQNTFKNSSKASNHQNFTPLVIQQIFKKIKNEDVDFLGLSSVYSRPEWMIISSLAIPPPAVRPSIRQSDNQRSEDDLTFALSMIVKANKSLKNAIVTNPNNKKNIDNFLGYLQYILSTYMDNEIPGIKPQTQRSTYRPLKSITQRLKSKEGRLRMNIMGKRVDYSARTVISVDPNLSIDQFGVPEKIAMNLSFPETVNKFNIEKLREMVQNGPYRYPGAKTVTKGTQGNQRNISLKHVDVVKAAEELEIGDIVHRHLVDGDPCLFNRQPTLHKMSMMTHKIVILPYSTFRLNVTVCKPYNADFDGDEMNMHVPQSIQTQTELEQISLVPKNLISPGTSKPSIEIVQDTLVGSYLLTIKDIQLNEYQMNVYLTFLEKFNCVLPEPATRINDIPYWSGKQLFSLILPDINITQLGHLKIIHGQVMEGYLSESSLGSSQAGLIKQIYNKFGTRECVNFLNNTQKLITRWMIDHSFSISFGDSILTPPERKNVVDIIGKHYEEAYELIKMAHFGTFATELDDSLKYLKMEAEMGNVLSKLSEEVKNNIMDNISKDNNFYISGNKGSGSKGKSENMQQIMGVVGQQAIWGNRIENGFTDRTLPHFYKNDIGPDAKGYCKNSFIGGLSPSEMFFSAMGGRTGTIDTAIQTADSGYISRKLIKAQEDVMVNYDLSVRNSSGHIVQFGYGDDNLDPTKLEKINKIELYELNNEEVDNLYYIDVHQNRSYFTNFMTDEAVDEMMENEEYKNLLQLEYNQILECRDTLRHNYFKYTEAIGDVETYMPINLYRDIPSQLIKFNIESFDLSDLTPKYIIEQYDQLMADLVQYLPEKDENWKLFKIIFKSFLSCKRLLNEYRMTKVAYDDLLIYMKNKMISALITPGEMVGIIGAQTLGEISTQLTLNSVTYDTYITVRDEKKNIRKMMIGEFVEDALKQTKSLQYNGEKDTSYAPLETYYEIPSVSEEGDVVWKMIEAGTQHPVVNEDGSKTLLKITTEEQRTVIATKAKSFLQLVDGKIQAVNGDALKVGQYLPVSLMSIDYRETYMSGDIELNESFGYLIGSYCAVGNCVDTKILIVHNDEAYFDKIIHYCEEQTIAFEKRDHVLTIDNSNIQEMLNQLCGPINEKNLHTDLVFSNKEFVQGFIDAFINGCGIISLKEKSIRMGFKFKSLLVDIQQMLNIFNIYGKIEKEENNDVYYLVVTNKQVQYFANEFALTDIIKQDKLNILSKLEFKYDISMKHNEIPNVMDGEVVRQERHPGQMENLLFDKIISIEEVENKTNYVYDLTVKDTRNFNIYNGLAMRDTFHLAGVSSASQVITKGIPRLKEILRLSKNMKAKNMRIYLKEEYANDKENAKKIQPKFAYAQIKDVLDSSEIIYGGKSGNTSIQEDMEFIQSYKEFSELFDNDVTDDDIMSPWILRLKFDKESLMNKKITIQEIQEAIKEGSHNEQEIECIYSDDSAQDVIMRIRIKQEPTESFLDHMRNFEKQLTEFCLRGITNIENVILNETNIIRYNLDGSIEPSKEWVLDTNGSNLLEILNHDYIDVERTVTNDILEFHEVFGIEGTRELIYRELMVLFKDKHPNPRHIQMLADVMTYRGILMQIERHGMNKNPEIGPIAKASFEEVMNILTNSAVFAESDNMKGVSSNILAGQFCKNGTNSFELIMDEDKLLEEIHNNDYVYDSPTGISSKNINQIMDNIYENKEESQEINDESFNFGFGLENREEFMLSENHEIPIQIGDKKEVIEELGINEMNLEEIPTMEIDNIELENIDDE
jgi:DNA-directed RNA polymerase beta' subunit